VYHKQPLGPLRGSAPLCSRHTVPSDPDEGPISTLRSHHSCFAKQAPTDTTKIHHLTHLGLEVVVVAAVNITEGKGKIIPVLN
jgi:hypothetical protein